ncbi:histidine phosphatase superfamily [Sordaria brevicollis]|uniref:3-phytase n=1 Tax=Sordaria brevicollis TaxID=83679 RepID=A0AAE0PI72_SORBR|nr:histidine phosphatase superfamily [Sordaria brevicollis]
MDPPAMNGTSKASAFTSLFRRGGRGSKHKYSPLGHNGEASGEGEASGIQTQLLPDGSTADNESLDEESQLQQRKPRGLLYRLVWGDPNKIFVKLIMLILMIPLFSYLAAASLRVLSPQPVSCDSPELGYQCDQKTTHTWGQYSPFFSVPSEISPAVPDGCRLTFAQVLSRHGARFPTPGKAAAISAVLTKIKTSATWYGSDFQFIKNYDYVLGVDHLTAFGEQEMVNSGIKFYQRYSSLIQTEDPDTLPFVRASGQERVIASAENFTTGFYSALSADKNPPSSLPRPEMVIISEEPTANNTMHHGLCRAFEDSTTGDLAQAEFIAATFPPITARLNAQGFKGVTLSNTDVLSLMDLCPFDTVAYPLSSLTTTSSVSGGGKLSPFCSLFTASDWTIYDYLQSLGKYYGFGPGNSLAATQGVGYVNELIARLTRTPVVDHTTTNSTLDGDEKTFPLNRTVYADFSHDNDMMNILTALRIFEHISPMDNTTIPTNYGQTGDDGVKERDLFKVSWAVPFAGRVYFEKMVCDADGDGKIDSDEAQKELVRILVNDRVMRLNGCDDDEEGRCGLEKFVESMEFARRGGEWEKCFV